MSIGEMKNGPMTTPVVEANDETWGFYIAGESINIESEGEGLSRSRIAYEVNGMFTSEDGKTPKEAYLKLEQMLVAASRGLPPDNIDDIGTERDKRCVPLPSGAWRVGEGEDKYAIPKGVNVEESQWPACVKYSAVFDEPEKIPTVSVNDMRLLGGTIRISMAKPRLKAVSPLLSNKPVVYCSGREPRRISVSGVIRSDVDDKSVLPQGFDAIHDMLASDSLRLSMKYPGAEKTSDYNIKAESPSIETVPTGPGRGTRVSVSGFMKPQVKP